jgi:hypothetical protein
MNFDIWRLLGEDTISRKIPPFSMSSGNGGFARISKFGDFWVEILIRGKIPPFSRSSGNSGFA